MEVSLLNAKFENAGIFKLGVDLTPDLINESAVHQVVKSLLANRRQGNACTKTKALVQGGGKKPFKQKGTGRARQGSSRSPLMPGGGTMFGPTPRDFTQKINKKLSLCAIKTILSDKLQAGKLTVIEELPSNGKTNEMYKLLKGKNLLPVLLVTSKPDSLALRATKNLKTGRGIFVDGFSVYEAVKYENLVIEKEALEKLIARFKK